MTPSQLDGVCLCVHSHVRNSFASRGSENDDTEVRSVLGSNVAPLVEKLTARQDNFDALHLLYLVRDAPNALPEFAPVRARHFHSKNASLRFMQTLNSQHFLTVCIPRFAASYELFHASGNYQLEEYTIH